MSDHTTADALAEAGNGPLSRRAALAAGGVATASAALVAAGCSTYTPPADKASDAPSQPAAGAAPPAAEGAPNTGAPAAPAPAQGGGTPLGPVSSVPVGGGKVFAAQKVVVTQPTAGQFKAFSAVCPHKGCAVNKVANGSIECPCHDSKFDVNNGSVQDGPAKTGLAAKQVKADGGTLRLT
ncbi:Rieske (2Fe-2S) protein [Pseudonocardia acaciae]|uniref:Rieske (2Fe-2S) protein n=1 Tax=Pseudonocardia acaciae TaxID=551276 RepID=UPI0006857F65|nr:Rieske (2Fe-2S) protein [Pseudonocardia acaciae]